ncbi:hypothetical protein COU17_01595 [Candidatus Kaiserbacteria bacterium CG10_big_fil_rev_8_21_14_0_10_49_17]|uniref:Protein containing YHS domain protein n=1 Tax=Candidatus Kaiserbacteria bacterium CG10_big_fil_rev_8_21_14_0_10_49_17 TaxID=1974609 RepID=A0A2M6WEI8_9BACT|nr:MAG: hypothetical protein COU17_01595 [Candidatus Kaiserbacteria bacterium CG10_big_fil_rev_8_21_14_0_10_49_17]
MDIRDEARKVYKPKVKICVSGAAETGHCGIDAYNQGKELGHQIIRQGAVVVTGATTGFPFFAAIGAKEEGGVSIGFSPAASFQEHVETYKLPAECMDLIVYTGFGFSGRNLLLTRSADAVIVGCGRIGTINEFTIAYEDRKPIGILEGSWQTDEVIESIIYNSHRNNKKIVFDSDPKALVEKVMALVKKDKAEYNFVYQNHDGFSAKSGDLIL